MIKKDLIALDGDGVLFDFNDSLARLWKRVYNEDLPVKDKHAYWATDYFGLDRANDPRIKEVRQHEDKEYWGGMIALPGVVEATQKLSAMGYKLVLVTAMNGEFRDQRHQNALDLGIPIDDTIATGKENQTDILSAKAWVLNKMLPGRFVDDFLPYFNGLNPRIHSTLIHRSAHDKRSQNHDAAQKSKVNWFCQDLPSFVKLLELTT